jgi:hypothetical protein
MRRMSKISISGRRGGEGRRDMLYSFMWVNTCHLNFTCRCFGTLCLFHLHRWCKQCSVMLAHKIQTLGNHPKERIQHSEYGKSLKCRRDLLSKFYIVGFYAFYTFFLLKCTDVYCILNCVRASIAQSYIF